MPPADSDSRRTSSSPPPSEKTPWRVEGHPDEHGTTGGGGGKWTLLWVIAALLAANWMIASTVTGTDRATVPYSEFRAQALADNVAEVSSQGETIEGRFREPVVPPGGDEGDESELFETERPAFADDRILGLLLDNDVEISATPDGDRSLWTTLLIGFGPTILLVALLIWAFRRAGAMQGGGGLLGGLGKSRARRYSGSEERTTFADVAGIEEVTDELSEVVSYLKNPDRYRRLGGQMPRGVLLTGPPGTGKTLLARALAGEAGVPFFSLSASEFVEMIVGVGASRVRDLFEQAKAAAPAIIFIDELDAIGRARGAGNLAGGSDEREQTLNQILTEMDGFTGAEGVIVLAATNRPEILDPALLRAGRFDRRLVVNPPDHDGRRRILEVHTRSVPLADGVDLDAVASSTPGMTGADLRTLVNEAALSAARRGAERVSHSDFTGALEKIVLGTARKILLSPADRRLTAYHEAGHALLGMLEPGADPVRKVSIIPRGQSLGVTFQSPEQDRYGYSARYLRGRIAGALGGRAAEELVFGDVTSGAESDLEVATSLARQMAGRWGMSESLGLVSLLPGPGQEGYVLPGSPAAIADSTRDRLDAEVRRITDECYAHALEVLREHRAQLDGLAQTLLERETLDEADAYQAAGLPRRPPENGDTASRAASTPPGATR